MAVAFDSEACFKIFLDIGGFQIENADSPLSIEKIAN